jgi:hypothetical protein
VGKLKETDCLENPDGRIILKFIFKKWEGRTRIDLCGLGQGQVAGCGECSSEPSSFINCMEFIY